MVFKTGRDLINHLLKHPNLKIDTLSMDHDLNDWVTPNRDYTGYDTLKEIINFKQAGLINVDPKVIQFHTSNMVGFINMKDYAKSAKKAELITSRIIEEPIYWLDNGETISEN